MTTSTKSRILKNSSAYVLVSILPVFVNFLLLPVYTKFLTPADYGILTMLTAFSAVLVPVIALQLNSAIPRYYFDYTGVELKKFFSTIVYSVIIVSAGNFFFLHIVGDKIAALVFSKSNISYYPLFTLVLGRSFLFQLSLLVHRLIAVQERGFLVLLREVIGQLVTVGLGLWCVVYMEMGIVGVLISNLIGTGLAAILSFYLVKEFLVLSWKKKYFLNAFYYSWPIIPHSIGGYLFMYSDRVVMERFLPLAAIGLYNIADKFSALLKMLVNSINEALIPNFMRFAKQNQSIAVAKFKHISTKWAVFISCAYLLLALLSKDIIILMLPESYHDVGSIVYILMIAYIFRGFYCFASYPLFFLKQTRYIPIITITAGVVNVGLNILIIPIWGIKGAAWTTVFSFFITFVLAHQLSGKFFKMQFEWRKLSIIFGSMFVFYGIGILIPISNIWLDIVYKLFIVVIFVFFLILFNYGDIKNDINHMYKEVCKLFSSTKWNMFDRLICSSKKKSIFK